jgi:hypothetical protein
MWLLRTGVLATLMAVCASPVLAQEQPPEPAEAGYEFVSGTVVDLPPGKIVVNRAVLGKPPETRTFTITADTKVEGRLRTNTRVTVGFKVSDEGDPIAVRIIVRPQNQRKP